MESAPHTRFVLFSTAVEPSLLPGPAPDDLLARWRYADADTEADRSSIYGGVDLYALH